jgi:hypothetical protein
MKPARFQQVIIVFLLLTGWCNTAIADSTDIWKKPRFFLQYDRYNSFVSEKGANISGLKAGLEFGKKFRFGIGIYNLVSDVIEYKKLTPEQAADAPADTVKAQLKMGYVPLCFEYIFYDKNRWQFGLPVHLGFGETYFNYFDKAGKTQRIKGQNVVLTDIVISGQFKVVKWVGLGAGIGVRMMLVDNPDINRDFNSPLYNIRLKIFLGEIYRSVFPHGLCGKKNKAAEQQETN